MKVNFFTAYGLMWKRCFDYKGISKRAEFWFPFIWQCIFGTIITVMCIIHLLVGLFLPQARFVTMAILGLLVIYMVVSIIPFASLTVRRLEDTGKSGWYYLLVLFAGVGTVIVLVLCAAASSTAVISTNSGGGFFVQDNIPAAIYGPPEDYDPSNNVEPDIYGPPEMFSDEEPTDPESCETESEAESKDPESADNEPEENPEEFSMEMNENVCIYGPPEMFMEESEE